jgi:ubiquinone/menaquinone biosynthesis C-methylase UbiE
VNNDSPYRDPAVAEIYRRIAVPTHFVRPARDLVTMMRVEAGTRVLDVGTGTGAFASAARDAVGFAGLVVGVDRAAAMLRAWGARDAHPRVVAETPGLPFGNDAFDGVGASFVLAHCHDRSSVLADMARVCRAGGHIGISAWGSLLNEPGRLWRQIVETYVDPYQLQQAFRASVPYEEWFHHAPHVTDALAEAGLTGVHGATREYTIEIAPRDYLAMKQAGVEGRLIRQLAGEAAWNDFTRQIDKEFQEQFAGCVTFVRDVHFGVGTKRS